MARKWGNKQIFPMFTFERSGTDSKFSNSVFTDCRHFRVTSEKLSQALGHSVYLMPTLDSEFETCETRGWQTEDRTQYIYFEDRVISKSRTKHLGLSAVSTSLCAHMLFISEVFSGGPNICLNHFTKLIK